jgi:CubicO group peptidase (beta-lactamase class C family)
MRVFQALTLASFLVSTSLFAAALDSSDQQKIIDHFNAYVDDGKIPHVSILVKQDNKEIFRHVYGKADIASNRVADKDTIYRIYSMSKPITGVAIMQLLETGKLRLNDKVSKYIPAFKNTKVLNTKFQDYVVKPKREITIRDLLTHTSGLTYSWAGEGPVHQIYRKYNIRPYFFGSLDAKLAKFPGNTCEFASIAASAPLLHNPGEDWSYGINMDVLGCVVEVVSGMSFADYLDKNIFKPLKMNSTGFSVKSTDKKSFTSLYGEIVGPLGANYSDLEFSKSLRSIDAFDKSPYLSDASKLYDGGSGLVSSIDDYSVFSEMLLNNGELNGVRILSEASVKLMSRNHLNLDDPEAASFGASGIGFGLTVGVLEDAGQAGMFGPDGQYFWGGAASTTFWVDPEKKITAVLMTQFMPSDKYPLREDLRALLYSGISN